MKKNTFTTLIAAFLLLFSIVSNAQITLQDPSSNPPGGLLPSECPQFVTLGFDDNENAENMTWILDFMKSLKNPAGAGQASTYDGTSARANFYISTCYYKENATGNPALLKLSHNRAYTEGHEIGNHTNTHGEALKTATTQSIWDNEMATCKTRLTAPIPTTTQWSDNLAEGAGIPSANIYGFRTPFLVYGGPVFPAVKQAGLVYDCSIEEGMQTDQDGTNFFWPYTFDHSDLSGHYAGWTGNLIDNPTEAFKIPDVPGLWELANHNCIIPDDATCTAKGYPTGMRKKINTLLSWFLVDGDGKFTAFDYNFWIQVGFTKEEVLAILKHNFDLRYNGNRAPFMFGCHTGEYPSTNPERREAIQEYITYALSFPDTRMVRGNDIINWCKNPKPLAAGTGPFTLTITSANGFVAQSGTSPYASGTDVTLTATPNTGYEFLSWSGGVTGTTNPITIKMDNNKNVTATYKQKVVGCDGYVEMISTGFFAGAVENPYLGSIVDTSSAGIDASSGTLTVPYTVAKMSATDAYDTYVMVGCYFPEDVLSATGLCSITLTYKSDKPLIFSLDQPPLDASGISHQKTVAASSTVKTIDILLSEFAQPDWMDPLDPKTPLDLTKVTSISIQPDVTPSAGAISGSFEITSMKLNGLSTILAIINRTAEMSASILNLHSNSLTISDVQTGSYLIEVYSIDGKLVHSSTNVLSASKNTISFNQQLNNGIYMVRVTGTNGTTMKKVILN